MTQIKVGEKSVTVRELSFKEVRSWIQEEELLEKNKQFNFVSDAMPVGGLSVREICRMTDVSQDEIEEMTPSQLLAVAEACKEMNPYFFPIRDRVITLAQNIRSQGE